MVITFLGVEGTYRKYKYKYNIFYFISYNDSYFKMLKVLVFCSSLLPLISLRVCHFAIGRRGVASMSDQWRSSAPLAMQPSSTSPAGTGWVNHRVLIERPCPVYSPACLAGLFLIKFCTWNLSYIPIACNPAVGIDSIPFCLILILWSWQDHWHGHTIISFWYFCRRISSLIPWIKHKNGSANILLKAQKCKTPLIKACQFFLKGHSKMQFCNKASFFALN